MADHHHTALVVGEELLQPHHGGDVEVVGRLVEEQDVGFREQRLGQEHPHLQRRVDLAHLLLVHRRRYAQVGEHLGCGGLLAVAIELGEALLEVRELGTVGIGEVRLAGQGVHRLLEFPDLGVALEGHVDDAFLLMVVDVLAQPAHALARIQHDLARDGLDLAGEDPEEGRLAGAVGADQAIAVAGDQAQVDVLEQHLLAEGHGELAGGDHGHSRVRGGMLGRRPPGQPASPSANPANV